MKVARAMILAAGYGTRLLPATKAVPKEMLPLVDAPVIEYIVDEAVASGIDQIVMVVSAGKRALEEHFGRVHELEQLLEAKGDAARLERVRRSTEMARIVFVRQHEMGGIGHAVLQARHAIGDEPFVVMLPDDVICADPPATRQLLTVFDEFKASVVLVEPVPTERIQNYGVIRPTRIREAVYQVEGLVEKPRPEQAPSNLAIIGRYVFTPKIFDVLQDTPRGVGGELQITDAMQRLVGSEKLYACELSGRRYDTGQPAGYLQASIEMMLQHPAYGPELRDYLQELMQPAVAGERRR
ncbi:MAG: UTP--glucose-1-phosphate uridylyltransferase GalU [Dehalococcoidia bacterium]